MSIDIVNNVRLLSAELPNLANSGHPGVCLGAAGITHALFSKIMNIDRLNQKWWNRDRFVLSNGHGSALLYTQLYLMGYITREDLLQFRQMGSLTAGHPEWNHCPGVEVTTGPLGQGISNAVGFAIAQKMMAARYNKDDTKLFDHKVYCMLGDGCMQEGVASEACSLAGHLGLDNLVALWDDNHITIDGHTNVSFTEFVQQRFAAYGWEVLVVADGDHDHDGIEEAIRKAQYVSGKPVLIAVKTTIGFGAEKQDTPGVHGSPIKDDLDRLKAEWGFPVETLHVAAETRDCYQAAQERGHQAYIEWETRWLSYKNRYPELAVELEQRMSGQIEESIFEKLATMDWGEKPIATRNTSQMMLKLLAPLLPGLVGGSADLTKSNKTELNAGVFQQNNPSGREIRFGVREHAMIAIVNAMGVYGGFLPFGATFLVFAGYALGAIRVAALSHYPALYIMTHDSIGVGEDGPTHQPVETFAQLRSLPNLHFCRPADGRETAAMYAHALKAMTAEKATPCVIAGSRQNLPQLDGSSYEKAMRGGYVLQEGEDAKVTILATGSEVELAVKVAAEIDARVVSIPCLDLFQDQDAEYIKSVIGELPVLAVEAGVGQGWWRYAQDVVCMESYGASAPAKLVFEKFGFTVENVKARALALIQ
ncbi:hypothetical protein PCE1_002749 [Barthelona sp. PCE]